jgi:hypothetical protein
MISSKQLKLQYIIRSYLDPILVTKQTILQGEVRYNSVIHNQFGNNPLRILILIITVEHLLQPLGLAD